MLTHDVRKSKHSFHLHVDFSYFVMICVGVKSGVRFLRFKETMSKWLILLHFFFNFECSFLLFSFSLSDCWRWGNHSRKTRRKERRPWQCITWIYQTVQAARWRRPSWRHLLSFRSGRSQHQRTKERGASGFQEHPYINPGETRRGTGQEIGQWPTSQEIGQWPTSLNLACANITLTNIFKLGLLIWRLACNNHIIYSV